MSFLGAWIEVRATGFTTTTAAIALVGSLALLTPVALQGIRRVLIHVFERDAMARSVQMVALFLLIAGFHFDLLAS